MKKNCNIILCRAILTTMNSCAVMFNGSKKQVNIVSLTPDSEIYVDNEFAGNDVANPKLKRNRDHIITVRK